LLTAHHQQGKELGFRFQPTNQTLPISWSFLTLKSPLNDGQLDATLASVRSLVSTDSESDFKYTKEKCDSYKATKCHRLHEDKTVKPHKEILVDLS